MKNTMTKKERQKRRENIFFGALIGALILVVVLSVVEFVTKEETVEVMVTADGHVHTADGTHLGTVEEIFGEEAASLFTAGEEQAEEGTEAATEEATAETGNESAAADEAQ